MGAFRLLLATILAVIVIYTVIVIAEHGIWLFPAFFGDIAKMGWPGQFNMDFLGFLCLSAFWTAWRNDFSASGLGLGVLAFFLGAPFLTTYLLVMSYRVDGDVRALVLGERRANA